jgi:hypothetical protein
MGLLDPHERHGHRYGEVDLATVSMPETTSATSKVTNAFVEVGLVSVSILLALCGLGPSIIAIMTGVSMVWWLYVHGSRLVGMIRASALKTAGSALLAVVVTGIAHGIGFGFGAVLRSIIGLK